MNASMARAGLRAARAHARYFLLLARSGLAAAVGLSEDTLARAAGERRSKVAFDIELYGDQVKLTVVHDDFEPGSTVLELISYGWPIKLSNLKSMLERSPDAGEAQEAAVAG